MKVNQRSFMQQQQQKTSALGKQESCAIVKMTAQCALYMGALKILGTPLLRPRLLFPTFFVGLLFGSTL